MNTDEAKSIAKERFSNLAPMMAPTQQIKLCASGLLIRKGQLLLGRRVATDEAYPGLWCTPGGGVEFGETIVDALKREFVEETGLRVEPVYPNPRILERYDPVRLTHSVGFFWLVRLTHPDMAQPLDGFDKLQLFDEDSLIDMCAINQITPLTKLALVEFNQIDLL